MPKIFWHCYIVTNGECNEEPDWSTPPQYIEEKDKAGVVICTRPIGGQCKSEPKTCGKFISAQQIVDRYKDFHGTGIHKGQKQEAKPVEKKKKVVQQGNLF